MKSKCVAFFVCVVLLAVAGPVMAQGSQPPEQIKKWKPVIGHWKNQEELRDSPTGSWRKVSSEWEIQCAPGGFCVQIEGKTPTGEALWNCSDMIHS